MKNELNTCAKLRGVQCVPWRTLHEFNYFLTYCVFGDKNDKTQDKTLVKYREKFKKECPTWNDSKILENSSKLFLDYCMEVYN